MPSLAGSLLLCLTTSAWAGTAHFDRIPEGATRRSLTEDGVTISGFDNRVDPPPGVLTAEDARETLAGLPGFSPPGVLGFGGYVPGGGAAFGQFGALQLAGPVPADAASVEVFDLGNTGVQLQLVAWWQGAVVASDAVTLSGWTVGHHTLAIEGVTFDRLTLVAGDTPTDVVYISLDDVRIERRTDPVDTDTTVPTDSAAPTAADSDTGGHEASVDGPDTDAADPTPGRGATDVPVDPTCGCAQAPGAPSGLVVVLALLAAARRRR